MWREFGIQPVDQIVKISNRNRMAKIFMYDHHLEFCKMYS